MFLFLSSCQGSVGPAPLPSKSFYGPQRFAVYYGAVHPFPYLARVDWAIVQDSYPPERDGRTRYFAYVSLGEIDPGTPVEKEIAQKPGGVAGVTLGKNVFWDSRIVDIRQSVVRHALLGQIERDREKGFGGVFFDTLDSPLEYRTSHPRKGEGMRRAMTSFIETVHASYPDLPIVVNRGFDILPNIAPSISGVLFEDFCSRFDQVEKRYVEVPAAERMNFQKIMARARAINPHLVVMALDYDNPEKPLFADSCERMARKEKFLHYMSDWTLVRRVVGRSLGGIKE